MEVASIILRTKRPAPLSPQKDWEYSIYGSCLPLRQQGVIECDYFFHGCPAHSISVRSIEVICHFYSSCQMMPFVAATCTKKEEFTHPGHLELAGESFGALEILSEARQGEAASRSTIVLEYHEMRESFRQRIPSSLHMANYASHFTGCTLNPWIDSTLCRMSPGNQGSSISRFPDIEWSPNRFLKGFYQRLTLPRPLEMYHDYSDVSGWFAHELCDTVAK